MGVVLAASYAAMPSLPMSTLIHPLLKPCDMIRRASRFLCGSHQIKSAKRLLSKNTIQQADKNPRCRQVGYASHLFDIGNGRPSLSFGSNDFTQCGPQIKFDGETFFEFLRPELKSRRWRLSARFKDRRNRVVCEINENEFLVNSGNFDVVETATKFEVRPEVGSPPCLELVV